MTNRIALAVALLLGLLPQACSSQAGSQSKGADTAGACDIDAKAICQTIRNIPVVQLDTGITADASMKEQNSFRTATILSQYPLKSGNNIMLECYMNTHTNSVVYAKASIGASLSAEDADSLRAIGACKQ